MIPPDLANLLAVAIRDVLWYKKKVKSFLDSCDVPKALMIEVEAKIANKDHTIPIVLFVLEWLSQKGDEGDLVAKKIFSMMYYWKDMHSVPPERKDQAVASLKELQKAYKKYTDQEDFKKQQKKQEVAMQVERESKRKISDLDHDKLQGFRDEFDRIHSISDAQERGNEFEKLMNEVFKFYCDESKGSFNRTGEQLDGLFKLDGHWHYVEIRWRKDKANAADISVLRDRAKEAFGGDTKALFISFNGFSSECIESLAGKSDERVILMDGYDLRCTLDCLIAFDVLLMEKQAEAIQNKRVFVGVNEILQKRNESK